MRTKSANDFPPLSRNPGQIHGRDSFSGIHYQHGGASGATGLNQNHGQLVIRYAGRSVVDQRSPRTGCQFGPHRREITRSRFVLVKARVLWLSRPRYMYCSVQQHPKYELGMLKGRLGGRASDISKDLRMGAVPRVNQN